MGIKSKDMAQSGHTGERAYPYQLGSGLNYDTPGVTGGTLAFGTDMKYHDITPKGEGGIHGHWVGGGDLENNHLHNKRPTQGVRIPT